LTLALVEGECSVPSPCRFTPGERELGTHWIERWVGPGAGMDEELNNNNNNNNNHHHHHHQGVQIMAYLIIFTMLLLPLS
jgi:hypothetical protein